MKKIFILVLVDLLLTNVIFSQVNLVPNPGFEISKNGTPRCTYDETKNSTADKFDDDIAEWYSARKHQTGCWGGECIPSVDWKDINCGDNISNYSSDRYVMMIGDDNYHEGVRVELDQHLEGGKTYTMRMKVACMSNGIIRGHLTEKGEDWDNSNNNKRQMDAFNQGVNPINSSLTWYTISQDIFISPVNDNALFYLVLISQSGWIYVDDVELYLYVIELEKKNKILEKRITELGK